MPGIRTASAICCFALVLFACKENKPAKTLHASIGPPPTSLTDTGISTTANEADADCNIDPLHHNYVYRSARHYTVKNNKITRIGTPGKLLVTVNPAVLETIDGEPVSEDIDVSVVELVNSNDLFKASAATVSNGRLLVSGGSYYVGMRSGGKELRIRKGQSMEMRFPVIDRSEMELFYGQRDSNNVMNWRRANQPLEDDPGFTVTTNLNPLAERPQFAAGQHLFNSGKSKVFFNDQYISLDQLMAYFRSRGINKVLDTVYTYYEFRSSRMFWSRPKTEGELRAYYPGWYVSNKKDTGWKGHSSWQVRIISPQERDRERDSLLRAEVIYDSLRKTKKDDYTFRLNDYYTPIGIKQLGWINCDRFYEQKQRSEIELELPITWGDGFIQYYMVYKSFNGLMNGNILVVRGKPAQIGDLPTGQPVTFIAFTKKNGIVSYFKQDIITGQNKKILIDPKPVTADRLNGFFGKASKT